MIDNGENTGRNLSENERRDLLETASKVRRAVADIPAVDVDKEWERLKANLPSARRNVLSLSWRQIAAAACVAVVVGSVAATVALRQNGWTFKTEPQPTASVEAAQESSPALVIYAPADTVASNEVHVLAMDKVYEEMSLNEILTVVANLFDVEVECDPAKIDIRLYLSIPAGSSVDDLAELLSVFDQLDAKVVRTDNGSCKLSVR